MNLAMFVCYMNDVEVGKAESIIEGILLLEENCFGKDGDPPMKGKIQLECDISEPELALEMTFYFPKED